MGEAKELDSALQRRSQASPWQNLSSNQLTSAHREAQFVATALEKAARLRVEPQKARNPLRRFGSRALLRMSRGILELNLIFKLAACSNESI